jgi:hypothetical protein
MLLEQEFAMIYWLLERVLRRGFKSRRGMLGLGELEDLARSGTVAWALAQEKARLDYLAAKAKYESARSWRSFEQMLERLLQLYSTNAVIQSLIHEHLLTQLTAHSATAQPATQLPARDAA